MGEIHSIPAKNGQMLITHTSSLKEMGTWYILRTCFDFLFWAPSGSAGLDPKVMPLVQIVPNLGP